MATLNLLGVVGMSAFEFVFSLFGLLLGLSLAEVLGGLVRVVQARRSVRIGWLTPMLGLIVMLDLTTFWSIAWVFRDKIPPALLTLVIGLLVSGIYYFAASMVVPKAVEPGIDLDDYYLAHRREVLGAVIAANLVVLTAIIAFVELPPILQIVVGELFIVPMAVATLSSRRWVNVIALILTLAIYVFYVFGSTWGRG